MNTKKGFTLVEISIVIIIIALIVAVVLAGKTIARQAQIRTIMSDINTASALVSSFRSQYGQLPGDLDKASQFWPDCVDIGDHSCDGDGNGGVSYDDYITPIVTESKRAWHHLELAGLISQGHNGELTYPNFIAKSLDAEISIRNLPYGGTQYHNSLIYGYPGNFGPRNARFGFEGVLTGKEARLFDEKYDDGAATLGKLLFILSPKDAEIQLSDNSYVTCFDSNNNFYLEDDVRSCQVMFNYGRVGNFYVINFMEHDMNLKKGFTLVEVAIVLIIIALIVAGVIGGQSLVNQSKIKMMISKLNQIQASTNTFLGQYNQLPGDFDSASDFLV